MIMNLIKTQSTISCYLSKQFLQVSEEFCRGKLAKYVSANSIIRSTSMKSCKASQKRRNPMKTGGPAYKAVSYFRTVSAERLPSMDLLSTVYSLQCWKQKTEPDSLWTTASHRYVLFWAVIYTFCVTCRLFKAKDLTITAKIDISVFS